MSKEKNLTLVPGSFPVVDATQHTWMRFNKDGVRCDQLFGPAIDRLYEFEKLGLEPEEIKEILEKGWKSDVLLGDCNVELTRRNRELESEIERLKCLGRRRYAAIQELQNDYSDALTLLKKRNDEIKALSATNTELIAGKSKLKSENDALSIGVNNQNSYIKELQKENEELKRQLKNLKESLAILAR
jgi:chromosome segregation ATPase